MLNIQLSYSQDVNRVSEFKTSIFQGRECDDTQYRDSNGSPAWKNYGGWLSECDSLESTYQDSVFAVKRKKQQEKERLEREQMLAEPLDDLDLDAMWENTVWEEIVDIAESEAYEVETITAVAGVRGAEAEDEALNLLYYRKSMKGLSELQLRTALGKLLIKRSKLQKQGTAVPEEIDKYILVLQNKIKYQNKG